MRNESTEDTETFGLDPGDTDKTHRARRAPDTSSVSSVGRECATQFVTTLCALCVRVLSLRSTPS